MWKRVPKPDKREQGNHYEALACRYLKKQGLKLVERNVLFRHGEIDLVMQDEAHLVFVEVRFRKSSHFGGALASIDIHKQHKLTKAAQSYLQSRFSNNPPFCRFDVVAIQLADTNKPEYQWIKNAF